MPFRRAQLLRGFADVRAGVVHQDIDTAKGVQGLLYHSTYCGLLTDIHTQLQDLYTITLTEFCGSHRRFDLVPRRNDNISPSAG
jgi:hypothetical protein